MHDNQVRSTWNWAKLGDCPFLWASSRSASICAAVRREPDTCDFSTQNGTVFSFKGYVRSDTVMRVPQILAL